MQSNIEKILELEKVKSAAQDRIYERLKEQIRSVLQTCPQCKNYAVHQPCAYCRDYGVVLINQRKVAELVRIVETR